MENEVAALHPDQQLAADLKAGRVTQAEVDEVWRQTWDLSPQTPITVRRAVIAIRGAAKDKGPLSAMAASWPMFAQEVMRVCTEMQAAMMRDESKFAHLVAGTEAVVKTLGGVNPLKRRLADIEGQLQHIAGKLSQPKRVSLVRWQRARKARYRCGCGARFDDEDVYDKHLMGCAQPSPEAIPDPEQEADEARRETIGSAWAK